jgi:hypothetical protein
MGKKELNEAMIDVLRLMRNEIDTLSGLKNFHEGDPIFDEAIELAKDKVFNAIEDIILYIETDDAEGEKDVVEDDEEND